MGFVRKWGSSCPLVYDTWQIDGTKWLIQDLPPEDDETALDILKNHLLPDELLCSLSNFIDDATSLRSVTDMWLQCLAQRMSLACYTEIEGRKTLVAINVCAVNTITERVPNIKIEGDACKNVFCAVQYLEQKCDPFQYFGYDTLLLAMGLVVKKEYRGRKIGSRLLSAREFLCRHHGIKATCTAFNSPAAQISAAQCRFITISKVSLKELVENGFKYPAKEDVVIKQMVKRYV